MNIDCRPLSSWKGRVDPVPNAQALRAHCNLVLLYSISVNAILYIKPRPEAHMDMILFDVFLKSINFIPQQQI